MNAPTDRLEFAPPPTGGLSRALVLAVIAHLVLVAALTLGVQWRRTDSTVLVEAELWSAIPKAAAPRLVEPPPAPPPPPPPKPAPVIQPTPAAPSADADIALQREKDKLRQEKLLAAQQRVDEQRKKDKLATEKKREQEQAAAAEKKRQQDRATAQEKQREQEQLQKEQKDKLAAEKKREQEKLVAEKQREQDRLQTQKTKEEQARLDKQRQVNLQRMAGLAGASGAPGSAGTAQKSSGPSSSYGGRVSAMVKPNIVFTETTSDNPAALVEVRAAPDGTIVSRKLIKGSGNKAWDDAVLKAIDKTAVLPRDTDGTVPQLLEINFRRHD